MFRPLADNRKSKFYLAVLDDLGTQVFTGLLHDPTQVAAILNGDPVPDHWLAATLAQLPNEPQYQGRVRSHAAILARRYASRLLQSTTQRDRLNADIAAAQAERAAMKQEGDQAKAGLAGRRTEVRTHASALAEKNGQIAIVRRRIRSAFEQTASCYAAGAGFLVGETAAVASALFEGRSSPSLTQQIGVWCLAIGVSATLGWLSDSGLRPLFNSTGGTTPPPQKHSTRLALVGTGLLATAVAGMRVYRTGEGGAGDLFDFGLVLLTIPFLALLAGGCFGAGRRQSDQVPKLRQELQDLENKRIRLNAKFVDTEINEEDQTALYVSTRKSLESAALAEEAAIRAKEVYLLSLFQSVACRPEMREIPATLARDAAELDSSRGGGSASAGIITTIVMVILLGTLSGCAHGPRTFGGAAKRAGVEVLVDPSGSVSEPESFRLEGEGEFVAFLRSAQPGSKFECWSIYLTPGSPRILFGHTTTEVLPRNRKAAQKAALAELRVALERVPKPGSIPWSSVLEDGYRCAERLSALPLDHRRVVVMSDLLQHSPTLKLGRILSASDPEPLVEEVLRAYPPFSHPPDEVRLVSLPGRAGGLGNLPPASAERVRAFWRLLWSRWGARQVETTEPATIAPGVRGGSR